MSGGVGDEDNILTALGDRQDSRILIIERSDEDDIVYRTTSAILIVICSNEEGLPQLSFISKCIAPLGNTVAEPGGTSFMIKRAPFSARNPAFNVPFTAKLISVARGCVCGVLNPQGPRKPIVIATPLPTRAGNESLSAATVWPAAPVVNPEGGCRKSKTYCRREQC